ncbi:MAG: Ig-like domain-containing protein [Leadbetterella sp.]|nr:Ig-like domain-containing protein [Leadbetterella sp.]
MKIIYFLLVIYFAFSCAQIVQPTGGQNDKTPPDLVSSFPENKTKNYKSQEFRLTFNELVDASSIQNELFIVPDPGSPYETKVKNNIVTLKFDKPLAENTTYTLNFRNGIKDLTERNPARNLKLVISTGDQLDSLQLNGTIIDLFTKEPQLDVTVGLYPADTLPFAKKKPLYFVKTDSTGKYALENLKNNKYFLLAFTDKNNNLRFDQKEEYLAFLPDSLDLQSNTDLPTMEIYRSDHSRNKIKRTLSRENEFVLQLDKNAFKAHVTYENLNDTTALSHHLGGSHLNFYKLKESIADTVHAVILLQDSLLVTDTLYQKIYFKEERTRKKKAETLPIQSNIRSGQEITTDIRYELSFEKPLIRMETDKIKFLTDTLEKEKIDIQIIDNQHINITIKTRAQRETELRIPPDIFENYLGDTNAVFLLKNPVLQSDQTGLLEGETPDTETPKIAILQNEQRTKEFAKQTFTGKFLFENVIPGTYNITVIYDTNQNGIWDPGNLEKLTLPEKIVSTKEPLRVRANYELRAIKLE